MKIVIIKRGPFWTKKTIKERIDGKRRNQAQKMANKGVHMLKKVLVIGLVGLVAYADTKSQESQKAQPLGTILGIEGVVYPKDKQRAILQYSYLKKDTFYDGKDEVNDPQSKRINREGILKQYIFTYRRALIEGWDGRVTVPFFDKTQKQNHPDGIRREWENSGLGDISFIIKREILNQKKGDWLFLSLGAGAKLPTGSTSKEFIKYYPQAQGGEYKTKNPMELQLGSGSYDPIFELGATKFLSDSRIDAGVVYQLTTKGKNDYEFGDSLRYSLAYTYMLHPMFDVEAGLLGNLIAKDKYKNDQLNNKGGHTIFGELGVHIKPTKEFDISFGYLFLAYKDVNGGAGGKAKESYPYGQGIEDNRLMLRVGINF